MNHFLGGGIIESNKDKIDQKRYFWQSLSSPKLLAAYKVYLYVKKEFGHT